VSLVNTVLATITANAFREFSEAIEAGETPKAVAQRALKESWNVRVGCWCDWYYPDGGLRLPVVLNFLFGLRQMFRPARPCFCTCLHAHSS
jgi:hypothetical protein